MGKGTFLPILLSLFGAILMAIISIQNIESVKMDNEFYRLQEVLNNSSDAALLIAQEKNQVGLQNIDINPELISKVFYHNVIKGNNLPVSEGNLNYVYSKIPFVALILEDGIAVGYAQNEVQDNSGKKTYNFVWEQKMPYTVYFNGKAYALSMFSDKANSVLLDAPYTVKYGEELPEEVKLVKMQQINSRIVQIVKETINKIDRNGINIFIPPSLEGHGMVSITGPAFMSITRDFDLYSNPIDYFSLATTEFTTPRKIVAFEKDNQKLYCFEDEFDYNLEIIQSFDNMEDAAKQGYNPDLEKIK